MTFPPLDGPLAPERNPPIEPLWFQPSNFTITAITRGVSTTVSIEGSTSAPSTVNFVVGQLVRFSIPPPYGIQQISGKSGYVTSVPTSTEVVVQLNSLNYDAFNASPAYGPTPPQIAAIGDINTGPINATGRINQSTIIPGSFINISPSIEANT